MLCISTIVSIIIFLRNVYLKVVVQLKMNNVKNFIFKNLTSIEAEDGVLKPNSFKLILCLTIELIIQIASFILCFTEKLSQSAAL